MVTSAEQKSVAWIYETKQELSTSLGRFGGSWLKRTTLGDVVFWLMRCSRLSGNVLAHEPIEVVAEALLLPLLPQKSRVPPVAQSAGNMLAFRPATPNFADWASDNEQN